MEGIEAHGDDRRPEHHGEQGEPCGEESVGDREVGQKEKREGYVGVVPVDIEDGA